MGKFLLADDGTFFFLPSLATPCKPSHFQSRQSKKAICGKNFYHPFKKSPASRNRTNIQLCVPVHKFFNPTFFLWFKILYAVART